MDAVTGKQIFTTLVKMAKRSLFGLLRTTYGVLQEGRDTRSSPEQQAKPGSSVSGWGGRHGRLRCTEGCAGSSVSLAKGRPGAGGEHKACWALRSEVTSKGGQFWLNQVDRVFATPESRTTCPAMGSRWTRKG